MARFRTLSEAEHRRVSEAVTAAEGTTNGEIVTIVADRSDSYHDAGLHWAIGASFLLLAVCALFPALPLDAMTWAAGGWAHDFTPGELMTVLFVAMVALFLIVRYALAWMPLRLALTPGRTKQRRVHRRAVELFRVGAEHRTANRVGILVYLSIGEHRAEILADAAIAAVVPPERWGEAMAAMLDLVRAGQPGEGIAAAVERIGAILAEHFPKSEADVNELPDRLIEL